MDADIVRAMPPHCRLDDYHYDLPEKLIAHYPASERGASRLLVLSPGREPALRHSLFTRLTEHLPAGALLVANNTRVAPARLYGTRPSGGKIEMLLLSPPPLLRIEAEKDGKWRRAEATALLKPGKSVRAGQILEFGACIRAKVLDKQEFGRHSIRLAWQGDLDQCLDDAGHMPLPPYIKRTTGGPDGPNGPNGSDGPEGTDAAGQSPFATFPGQRDDSLDRQRYQTVYAKSDKAGSVAAPTAGLHFTPEMRAGLARQGFGWAELTLHVGYGTFSPVREADIRRHVMHSEYVEIPESTLAAVAEARACGRPIIAVGTTSARGLEGAALLAQSPDKGWQGWTNIFIYPGFHFQVITGLLTNFHLPRSSLLMLASALAGREALLAAYREAIREEYRFFSYGDATLILP